MNRKGNHRHQTLPSDSAAGETL